MSGSSSAGIEQVDAIVIGAGIAGMYQLLRLRELGLSVRVYETGTGVGGTWYWNRYPGARFDSESYSYGYSFSKELLAEWDWSEHFAAQPETLRYLEHVADRFDLRRDIVFESRVVRATFDPDACAWETLTADGRATFERLRDEYRAVMHEEMATLPDRDVRTLAEAIEILDVLIERLTGQEP